MLDFSGRGLPHARNFSDSRSTLYSSGMELVDVISILLLLTMLE